MIVRSLTLHATYRCRHAGACCTANWPIPVEADRLARLQAALATGRLRPAAARAAGDYFVSSASAPIDDPPALLATTRHACVFFDEAGGRLCRVHEALGHEALPLACRQFPRVVVRDPRGVSVVLSHYCPTAASMLAADAPVAITESPAAFPAAGEYDGLDATHSLPPMLRPDVLMDWDSWWEVERLGVALIAGTPDPAEVSLARLRECVAELESWDPRDGPLIDRVRRAFQNASPALRLTHFDQDARCQDVLDAVPPEFTGSDGHRLDRSATSPPVDDRVVRRYLAAHAFGNWTAHLGRGLRAWVRSIEAAYALVQRDGDVRQADLYLRHLADPWRLAELWSVAEFGVSVRRTFVRASPRSARLR